MRWLTVRELMKKYKIDDRSYGGILKWIKKGWLKGKRKKLMVERRLKNGKVEKFKVEGYLVSEESWLEIPTFIRNKLKVKK